MEPTNEYLKKLNEQQEKEKKNHELHGKGDPSRKLPNKRQK